VVGSYFTCIPITQKPKEQPVFHAKKGIIKGRIGLIVTYPGDYVELPFVESLINTVPVVSFKVASFDEAPRRARFLLSSQLKCRICKENAPEKHDLCYTCNQNVSHILGQIKKRKQIPYSPLIRKILINNIVDALKK